jgi:site-specific DNA-methyltransferase (adenine-specific)/site-specific DNA-methyltransferase (cytosine-N4-specific)
MERIMTMRSLFDRPLPDRSRRAALRLREQLVEQYGARTAGNGKRNDPFPELPRTLVEARRFSTGRGMLLIDDCLRVLSRVPDDTFDVVLTSPPYDGQPKYGNGERYERDWYEEFFIEVTREILRTLKPHGSFILNYRSKRHGNERGTLQYELVFWLRKQGFLFCEDFVWGKPSPPPGRFKRFLKDAVEYCFQFAKTEHWQFFPEHCLTPARWDEKDRERRKRLAHNYVRVNAPSGQGRKRVQAGPDLVRPSTLLHMEADFTANPTRHPARFPIELPTFFIKLLSKPGQLVFDPFAGTCTTAVAAERLERRWLVTEADDRYARVLPERLNNDSRTLLDARS